MRLTAKVKRLLQRGISVAGATILMAMGISMFIDHLELHAARRSRGVEPGLTGDGRGAGAVARNAKASTRQETILFASMFLSPCQVNLNRKELAAKRLARSPTITPVGQNLAFDRHRQSCQVSSVEVG